MDCKTDCRTTLARMQHMSLDDDAAQPEPGPVEQHPVATNQDALTIVQDGHGTMFNMTAIGELTAIPAGAIIERWLGAWRIRPPPYRPQHHVLFPVWDIVLMIIQNMREEIHCSDCGSDTCFNQFQNEGPCLPTSWYDDASNKLYCRDC